MKNSDVRNDVMNKREYNSERRRKPKTRICRTIKLLIRENITPRGDGNFNTFKY